MIELSSVFLYIQNPLTEIDPKLVMEVKNRQSIAAFNVFLFELEAKDVTEEGGLYHEIYKALLLFL